MQVDIIRHHFEDDDIIFAGLLDILPLTFCRRLQVGCDAVEKAGKVFLHLVEIVPAKWLAGVVGAGKQYLDEMHDDRSLKNGQRLQRPTRSFAWSERLTSRTGVDNGERFAPSA
ncbi:hypothetical protein [Mesorhizobium sp.]|uniref:hypothetical protein n=1 Tax=Mesorhizobium sp. TaxID=1871066 RepID=UPI000FE7B2A9|nr:hypothetical protein [Mesorhizobium sp.]RWK56420.1 MAG: hypothetical protein EOR48_06975 [Mesorhizobium sp.]RWK71226.1 MAG: hypothetical protein EOR45_34900 [Mesorhizobium sp.]TIP46853.1 MAG: hypothetical protein E5X62_07940 [Mesorhizobium sp.]